MEIKFVCKYCLYDSQDHGPYYTPIVPIFCRALGSLPLFYFRHIFLIAARKRAFKIVHRFTCLTVYVYEHSSIWKSFLQVLRLTMLKPKASRLPDEVQSGKALAERNCCFMCLIPCSNPAGFETKDPMEQETLSLYTNELLLVSSPLKKRLTVRLKFYVDWDKKSSHVDLTRAHSFEWIL